MDRSLTSTEIRNSFLKFFEERGHKVVPSASVIPYDDPTLLFTNAGMNQFKDVFLGTGRRDYVRAVDSQKCIRVSGKHNDLEEVGRDTYHHTFFEMLGNWSFGDYYKKEAIEWAWELLTKVWGLDKRRLYATVFESDDEAEQLWKKVTDIDPSHVLRFGKKDNFWEMGETGPCGPCSEIHIDQTDDFSGGKLVNAGDPRVMEIWNLVFIQYNRDDKGNLTPLPAKHVDTGMGFERICAVLQKKKSNYETDVFMPIISRISELVRKPYGGKIDAPVDIAMRVIADHVRMLSFSIADGGIPSNEGRGYVMRRILRRAARFGRNLGMHEPFIFKVVEAVVKSMGKQFPEIAEKQSHIERVIRGEEESFNATLDRGLEIFESVIKKIGNSKIFPGDEAFKLYDTYGFPIDLTQLMAQEQGIDVEMGKFDNLMEEQRKRSSDRTRLSYLGGPVVELWSIRDSVKDVLERIKKIDFDYYDLIYNAHVEHTIAYRDSNGRPCLGLVLDKTTFYAESGGQVSDEGNLKFHLSDGMQSVRVIEIDKKFGRIVHILEPEFKDSEYDAIVNRYIHVSTDIDIPRRHNIERNHTATHIFHEALRLTIGEHSHQQGSLVAPDHLRFDFNHSEKLTSDDIKGIEDIVNEKIAENILVQAENDPEKWISIEEAKHKYPKIKMFFGEKYGDQVRVVVIDPKFSVELCGGTHVKNTKDIGLFKIISESSIASGIRRIEAVTGDGLKKYIEDQVKKAGELNDHLAKLIEERIQLEKELGYSSQPTVGTIRTEKIIINSSQEARESIDLVERHMHERQDAIEAETKKVRDLKSEISKARVRQASSSIEEIIATGIPLNGFKVVSAKINVGNAEELKSLGDNLRSKLSSGVGVLGAVVDEKVALVCVVTDDLIKNKKLQAGKIVGELAKRVGGGGGGRPHLATAGGKDVSKLDEALQQTSSIVQSMLDK